MSEPTNYLTPADLYAICETAIGRPPDVRDRHLLRKAAARPMLAAFGAEAYPTLLDKAAALMHALAAHHLFYDGNKRAATAATAQFLAMNGLRPAWSDDEVYDFVLEIAQNQHDVDSVAAWLADHTTEATVRVPTVDELIYINRQLPLAASLHTIVEGARAVRDTEALLRAQARPLASAFGADAYPSLEAKAAALLHAIARNHPFADGNKRTATVAALFLLRINGRRAAWDDAEALERIVHLAEGALDPAEFAAWLSTEGAGPALPDPYAERDARLIAAIIAERAWLLRQLAGH